MVSTIQVMSCGSTSDQECTSSTSLLDILISSEYPSDEPDPLDGFGNIGDTVIDQLSQSIGVGQDVTQSALKMFEEVATFPSATTCPQKRKHVRRDVLPVGSNTSSPSSTPSLHYEPYSKQKCRPSEISTRSKYDADYSELFQESQIVDAKFHTFHEKMEKERTEQLDMRLKKDVDRLLHAANKIYGPKEWTTEEKNEFASYCRILRNGKLSDEDKKNLTEFYAKSYSKEFQKELGGDIEQNEETVKDILAQRSAICFPIKSGLFEKYEDELEKQGIRSKEDNNLRKGSSESKGVLDYNTSVLSATYEKDAEFRDVANNIFTAAYKNLVNKRTSGSQTPQNVLSQFKEISDDLKQRINEFMSEKNKVWKVEEVQQLGKHYETFKIKLHFTIAQSRELGTFIRKVFGKLELHEIDRENNTILQEKRQFWQEYKKTHEPVKAECRRSNKSGRRPMKVDLSQLSEVEIARRTKKAAYLRRWRLAQKEKVLPKMC